MFSGGDGVIYVVTASGELRWYRHLAREGTFNWENGGSPRVIATGWGTPIADSPPAPVRDDGELRVIEELGLRATLPAGAIVECDWRDARIVTNSGVEISLTVDSPIATLEGALQGIHQGWKRVLETLRYDTTADGWIVVVKMMRGSHGPVTGMTIRRRIAQMNVDIACEDNDGELDPSWVEAFAASLTALPGSIAEQVVPGTAPSLRAFIGSENWCARKTGVALWPDGLVQWTGPEYKTARGRFTQADESAVQALIERVRRSPCFAESGPNLGSSSPEFPRAIGIRIGDQWRDRGGPDVQQLVDDVTALTGWASALPPPPVYAAPGPWAPRERYAAPPPDAASLGEPPPGFTRLTGLDLDAKIPPADALVSSGWYGTSIDIRRSREPGDHWSIACTIDSPISTLDAAVSALVRENDRRKLQSIHRAEETSDGWVIFVTTTWDRSFASHAATVRRKLGRTTVDITADDRSVELPFIEALAKSLVLVPGGILEAPFPREEPVICASFGRGCWSGPGGGVALWSDGTAQYSGPRYRTVRGRFTKIDSALVAELHERIRTADCCVAPEDVRGPPLELRVRGDDGWKCCAGRDLVVRFGEVATLVGFARG